MSLGDKIEDCISSAKDTEELCREFKVYLSKVKAGLNEIERHLRQKIDMGDLDVNHPVNLSHRIVTNLLDEIEDDVGSDRNTSLREEGQPGRRIHDWITRQ